MPKTDADKGIYDGALEIVNDTEKKGGGLRQTRKQISEDVKDLVCPICGQNNNQEKGE